MNENSKEEEERGETSPQPSDEEAAGTSAVSSDEEEQDNEGSLTLEETAQAMFDVLEEMDELFEDEGNRFVDESMAREADMDAVFPMLASILDAEQEDQVPPEPTEFGTVEYADALTSFMGLMQLEDEGGDGEEEGAAGGFSVIDALLKLSMEAMKYLRRAPVFHYILGTFRTDPPVEGQQEEEERGIGEPSEESSPPEEKAMAMFAEPGEMKESHEDADEQLAGMSQAREADMETLPPTLASTPQKEKVSQLPPECSKGEGEVARDLPSFMGLNQPAGEECDNEENAGGMALPSNSLNKLCLEAATYVKRAPIFHHMQGTFATDSPVERPQLKRWQGEKGRGRGETCPEPSDGGERSTSVGPPAVVRPKIKRGQKEEGRGRGETGPEPSDGGERSPSVVPLAKWV